MDSLDQKLLDMLLKNAREPITSLAQNLGVSRATITERMRKLEESKVISGYSVQIADIAKRHQIAAHVMIEVEPHAAEEVAAALTSLKNIHALYAVSGIYDMIAILRSDTTEGLDQDLDAARNLGGVVKTVSSIILSTKLGD